MSAREFNFDGLVGPTHNYAGLSYGNVASARHRNLVSNPKAAALQGLEKMRALAELGVGQAILPPLPRPKISFLRSLGYSGSRQQIIEETSQADPVLLASCYSASNMWTANAATVSAAADCLDRRLHLTPANLMSGLHRSLEANETFAVLRFVFCDEQQFCVHPPLPAATAYADEGAANHTRFCDKFGETGVEFFVYGTRALDPSTRKPLKFPARQTLEASQAVCRNHQLSPEAVVFGQQNPEAIDAGVFHNDVISVGHQNVLLCHEQSFVDQPQLIDRLKSVFVDVCGQELQVCQLSTDEISIDDCVASYLFNSQLISLPGGELVLLCPQESETNPAARECVDRMVNEVASIQRAVFIDLRQSMNNGGGPACLRLRVCLSDEQVAAVHPFVLFTDERYRQLKRWIQKHYRDQLAPDDLADPKLAIEADAALVELADILQMPLLQFGNH